LISAVRWQIKSSGRGHDAVTAGPADLSTSLAQSASSGASRSMLRSGA
jgi:2-keto-3-deoxy-L-rhamnonate aldolase RhmA